MTAMKERAPDMNEADRLAAATEYAREKLINDHARKVVFQLDPRTGKKLSRASMLSEAEFAKLCEANFREDMSEDDLERTYLKAVGGDKEAMRVMIDEALKYLDPLLRVREPDLKLPDRMEVIILELIVGILEGHKRRISAKRGGNADVNSLRNRYIVKVIEGLGAYGFKPTKNEVSWGHQSACSIIANVLADAGLKKPGLRALEKIWEKRRA